MNEDKKLPTEEGTLTPQAFAGIIGTPDSPAPETSDATTGNSNTETITINLDASAPVEEEEQDGPQFVLDEVQEPEPTFPRSIEVLPYELCEELIKKAKIDFYNRGVKFFLASKNTFGSLHIHRLINLDGSVEGGNITVFTSDEVKDGFLIEK